MCTMVQRLHKKGGGVNHAELVLFRHLSQLETKNSLHAVLLLGAGKAALSSSPDMTSDLLT